MTVRTPLAGWPDDPALHGWAQHLEAAPPGQAISGLPGLPAVALLRARWRALIAQEGWWPLVEVEPRRAAEAPEIWEHCLRQARGGWLLLHPGLHPRRLASLVERSAGALRVLAASAEELPLRPAVDTVDRLMRQEPWHVVAGDPALSVLRSHLLAHCAGRGLVHLVGPPGSGREALLRWAHSLLGEGSLVHLRRGGSERLRPGQWALFEEPGELEPGQLHQLGERVQASLAPRSPAPALGGAASRPEHPALREIIGESAPMVALLQQLLRVAPSPRPVLILGASGTGKEGVARALHAASGRGGAFVGVDLSALPDNLIESELFGHARGAFTGADRARPGAFRTAQGGTLFLDELGNMSLKSQVKLLRVLQERQVTPVGEDRPVPVDVRVVAATNADIEAMVARGEFREDLWRRLNTFTLELPPLRERGADILRLAEHFLRKEGLRLPSPPIAEAARQALLAWPWTGNVRELENAMAAASLEMSTGEALELRHIAPLAPRRSAPTLTFAADDDAQALSGLPRHLAHALSAVTLRLPPLREREGAELRALIRLRLGPVPIRDEALHTLAAQPWWGNLTELDATLMALVAGGEGPIDLERLERVLPGLRADPRPLRVLLFPTLEEDGQVSGLRSEYSAPALLIGRISRWGEAERLLAAQPERRARIAELLGPATPACLNLSLQPLVSRLHLLITRGPTGLSVCWLPGARLPVEAGPLAPGGQGLSPLAPGQPLSVGEGGEVVLLGPDQQPLLRIYIFRGASAEEELAPEAARRCHGHSAAATVVGLVESPTARGPVSPAAPAAAAPEAGKRWVLDPAEREALHRLVLDYPGGEFKSWVTEQAQRMDSRLGLGRLAAYLLAAPNPSDYVGRLYDYAPNQALRDELCARLPGRPDRLHLLERLPARLRRVVEPG